MPASTLKHFLAYSPLGHVVMYLPLVIAVGGTIALFFILSQIIRKKISPAKGMGIIFSLVLLCILAFLLFMYFAVVYAIQTTA